MFVKTIANRLWDRVGGTPLVGDLLDMKESAMGANPKLTQFMITVMKKAKYDTKLFMKLIYKTQFYQRKTTQEVTGKYYFQGPVLRRLKSEQVWDSLLSIRMSNPEKSISLPDVLSDNLFQAHLAKMNFKQLIDYRANSKKEQKKILSKNKNLNIQHKNPKGNSGSRASEWSYPVEPGTMLQAFGTSDRSSIDASTQDATIPQALALMNDNNYAFNKTLIAESLKSAKSIDKKISLVYNAVLTREPTSKEKEIVRKYTSDGAKIESIYWALLNSHEFKLRK
jgi:hypothetical protein